MPGSRRSRRDRASSVATIWIFRHQTEQVLIEDGERRYFGKRSEVMAALNPRDDDPALNIDLDDESTFIDIQPRPCQYCGAEIGKDNQISERLLRCPNKKCEQLTYLTAEEVRPSYVE